MNLKYRVILILCMVQFSLAGIASAGPIDDVRASVHAWRKSWQNRDLKSYMSFYSPDFQSEGLDFKGLMHEKAKLFKTQGNIQIEITDLGVFIEADHATARFIQRYRDSKNSDVGEKTLIMVNLDGKWKIVSEKWKPLTTPARTLKERVPQSTPKKIASIPHPAVKAGKGRGIKDDVQNGIIIKSIKFEPKKDHENLFIASNKSFVPRIFTLEGDKPRIVIDIKPVLVWSGPYRTPVKGKIIRQIRTRLHSNTKRLRIVLDLGPSENYFINQIYYEKEHTYCIEVR